VRIECKSSQLQWNSYRWLFCFAGVKFARENVRFRSVFDQLVLMMYTPIGVYMYHHDNQLGVSAHGQKTSTQGYRISICGPKGVDAWSIALESILKKFDEHTNQCARLAFVALDDARIVRELAARSYHPVVRAYRDVPLASLSQAARGHVLENLLIAVLLRLHPDSSTLGAWAERPRQWRR